jgi:hypothetical protein
MNTCLVAQSKLIVVSFLVPRKHGRMTPMFEAKPIRLNSFSMDQIDQMKLNRTSVVIDTGETYTATDGTVVHVKRVLKA